VKHLHLCSLSTRLPCPDCGPNGDETELMLCLIIRGLESAEICNVIVIVLCRGLMVATTGQNAASF
jgi:hypothetical protein